MSGKVLFACSKCFSRHPFEELSSGQQLCKDCRGTFPVVKCTYCRSEFQQVSRGNTSAICKKCEQNVKHHGKPSACECCNIIAAFIGSKCQRCANSEVKYGPPVTCDQCKQRSAFDRHDDNKKVDGKLLCWLCTCSYKRAVAKARQVDKDSRLLTKKRPHHMETSSKENSSSKKSHRSTGTDMSSSASKHSMDDKLLSSRQTSSSNGQGQQNNNNNNNNINAGGGGGMAGVVNIDPNSSDHVVAMTQLKEKIAALQRRLNQKDKDLLEKDKMITELKGKNFDNENEMRVKLKETDRIYDMKIDCLNKKIATLLKEVATLKRTNNNNNIINKRNGINSNLITTTTSSSASSSSASTTAIIVKESSKDSVGSDADSPTTI